MRIVFTAACSLFSCLSFAQAAKDLLAALKAVNAAITSAPCDTGSVSLVSNRALNIFFANKTGTYLSAPADLFLHKNAVIVNTVAGELAVQHNLYSVQQTDALVRSMPTVGVKAQVADAFTAAYHNRRFANRLGITFKQTWMGKASTVVQPCSGAATVFKGAAGHKPWMDVVRAGIVHALEVELAQKEYLLEQSLQLLRPEEVPGRDTAAAKQLLRRNFAIEATTLFAEKFAVLQSDALIEAAPYRRISVGWTSFYAYIPLIRERFAVAATPADRFVEKKAYALDVLVSYSRLWESSRAGRFLLTLGGGCYLNNTKAAYTLDKTSLAEYRSLGGTDTVYLAAQPSGEAYLGKYRQFLTPLLRAQLVYIPPQWHFGLSAMLEQHLGTYHPLNVKLGIPIVLIDQKDNPDVTFEFQVLFSDVLHQVFPGRKLSDHTSIGLTMGIPFSKLVY